MITSLIIASEHEIRQTLTDRINLASSGREFDCKMIEPGIVSYLNTPAGDVILLRKETIDRCIATAMGNPLTIDHINMSSARVRNDDVKGKVAAVRYNAEDGWYYVSGSVEDDEARRLIRSGHKPSCAFKEKKVVINTQGHRYHGFHYDKEITELEFHHLAIVERPRYETASFRLNSTDPMKNIFTLLREVLLPRKNSAGVVELDAAGKEIVETTVERIELSPESEVEIGGKKMRLNDLGEMYLKQTAAATGGQNEDVCIDMEDGKEPVRVSIDTLKSAYKAHRKNEAESEAEKKRKEEEEAAKSRENAAAAKAEQDRKNAMFATLQAAGKTTPVIDAGYSTTSGSLAEKVAKGKTRF